MWRLILLLGSFIKKHRVFFFQITVSALLCILLLALFPQKTDKFIIEELSGFPRDKRTEYFFIDLDGDGHSNKIDLAYNPDNNQNAILIFGQNGSIIDQWNFSERRIPFYHTSGDYNNDGVLEFYVFTQQQDSLFLYIIDPHVKPQFLKKRLFIAQAENVALSPAGSWDIYTNGSVFTDLDNDGFRELIVSLQSGLSQFPRSVIAYNIKEESIMASTPRWGINISYPEYIVSPSSDSLFYFRISTASFNIHDSAAYKDDKTWLVVLDKKLQPVFNPIPFAKEFSSLYTLPVIHNDSLFFTVLRADYGNEVKKAFIYAVNQAGEIVAQRDLGTTTNYMIFQLPGFFSNRVFLCTDDSLFTADHRLTFEYFGAVPKVLEYVNTFTIGPGNQPAFLFFDLFKYWISDSSLSYFTEVSLHYDEQHYKVHPVYGFASGANLVIETSDKLYFAEYKTNPWYPYRYLYPAGLFAVCFGFVFTGYLYIKRRIFFHHFSDQLFQNAQRGIILLDHKGKIVKINSAIKDLLKINNSLNRGARFSAEFASFPVLRDAFSSMVLNKKAVVRDFTLQHKDETLRLQINGYPLHKENSEPVGYLIEILDYSDPIHKERMNMWSDTVKRFAHDLKTPLSSLFLMADNLQQKIVEYPQEVHRQMQADLKYFTGEITRLKKMTKRFAQFSDFQNVHFAPVSVSLIVSNALDELYSLITPGIMVTNHTENEDITILGDSLQLQQVLQILIKNAIEALSGTGEIVIKSYLAQNLKSDSSEMCTIDVCDNGCGINDEHRNKLFEPFFTTKADGSGLGLSIAKKIILEHHGQIYITENDVYTTIVRVLLPTGNNGVADV